jgi:hypothetical protein
MVSLSYSTADGKICGEVAMDIVTELQKYAEEADKPSSFRFHMATSLGGAIIILATLLCRDISSLGLQDSRSAYAESYQNGILLLRALASSLNAARRVLEDMKDITSVVDNMLEQMDNPPIGQHPSAMEMIPKNVDHLFPSDPLGFNVQFLDDWASLPTIPRNIESEETAGNPYTDLDMSFGGESWDSMLLRARNEFGVSWV